jgi:hypothetical protein
MQADGAQGSRDDLRVKRVILAASDVSARTQALAAFSLDSFIMFFVTPNKEDFALL